MKTGFYLILLIVAILLFSCREEPKSVSVRQPVATGDSQLGYLIADTITYDVIIRNSNPDDDWTEKCLKYLNRKALIDSIFTMAYAGEVKVYDLITREQLTQRDLKTLESQPGFNRNNISSIQFTEAWYFNPREKTMTKKVLALGLGFDYYTSDGEYVGHKPVFKVVINP